MSITIRVAVPADLPTLVEFNRRMAWETERKELDLQVLTRGVASALADPGKGFYLIADCEARAAGQLMITREWSDWRNGDFWWIQSVYVAPEARRAGVFRALYQTVEQMARQKPGVIGIRLYVERDNDIAQRTYLSLGMSEAPYRLFELYPLPETAIRPDARSI